MPLSVAIGRRPVFLASLIVLLASSIWCAAATSLSSHIAGRNIFSIAAGQSEALAPFIIEEIHFLHERSAKLSWFVGVQTVSTALMFVATTALVPAWGLKWWYGIIAIVAGALLLLSILFMVETEFDRPSDADNGLVHVHLDAEGQANNKGEEVLLFQVTKRQNHVLQPDVFGPRTWNNDLKLFHKRPDWSALLTFYKETFQCCLIPNVFWLLVLNGAFLSLYVYQASTFAPLLMGAHHFTSVQLGWVQLVQVADCALLIPLLGYRSDYLVKVLSKWHSGVFMEIVEIYMQNDFANHSQPEYRLIPLIFPAACEVVSAVMYGRGAQNPQSWHWMSIVAPYHLGYFAFIGCNVVSIAYCVDSFPRKAGPLLLVICAGRGFISFGLSYSTVPAIASLGYERTMDVLAIIAGVLSGLVIPAYLTGRYFRKVFSNKVFKEKSAEH